MNEDKLSHKSKEFLDDLRVYLFSSGKNEEEMDEIIDELKDHLIEAEKQGKSVDHLIGQSPKDYMEKLSREMPTDYITWVKYVLIIMMGAFSFKIADDIFAGELAYSLLDIVGHILIVGLFLLVVFGVFKYIAVNDLSMRAKVIIFGCIGLLPISLFVGLIYLNRFIETPVITFGLSGTIVIGILTAIFLIAVSWWARTWVLLIILAIVTLPEHILATTPFTLETKLLLESLLIFGGVAIYLFVTYKIEKAQS